MPFTKQHSAYAWVVTCILFLINLTFHNLPLHSSYKIHQPFTDYFLRLPYSELLEKRTSFSLSGQPSSSCFWYLFVKNLMAPAKTCTLLPGCEAHPTDGTEKRFALRLTLADCNCQCTVVLYHEAVPWHLWTCCRSMCSWGWFVLVTWKLVSCRPWWLSMTWPCPMMKLFSKTTRPSWRCGWRDPSIACCLAPPRRAWPTGQSCGALVRLRWSIGCCEAARAKRTWWSWPTRKNKASGVCSGTSQLMRTVWKEPHDFWCSCTIQRCVPHRLSHMIRHGHQWNDSPASSSKRLKRQRWRRTAPECAILHRIDVARRTSCTHCWLTVGRHEWGRPANLFSAVISWLTQCGKTWMTTATASFVSCRTHGWLNVGKLGSRRPNQKCSWHVWILPHCGKKCYRPCQDFDHSENVAFVRQTEFYRFCTCCFDNQLHIRALSFCGHVLFRSCIVIGPVTLGQAAAFFVVDRLESSTNSPRFVPWQLEVTCFDIGLAQWFGAMCKEPCSLTLQ